MPLSKTLCIFDALAGRPPTTGYPHLDLRNGVVVLDFDDAVDEAIDLLGVLPRGYTSGDLEVVVTWAATSATSGDALWQAQFERHPIADDTHGTHDLDADSFGATSVATGIAAAASGQLVRTSLGIAAVDANSPEPGESFRLRLSRLGSNGSDTLTGDVELVTIELREV